MTLSLKDKITSEEVLKKVLQRTGDYENALYYAQRRFSSSHKISWWVVRENERFRASVYKTTNTLDILNSHAPGIFAHISLEDPNMVAYTPDKTFGEEDRQLRLTIGKLVTKVLYFANESYIRGLVEDHLGELTNHIDWLVGEEIVDFYSRTPDNSMGTCMVGKDFSLEGHPSTVYNAEGIKMAVLYDSNKKINARSLVYENGEDKRYIRVYGDPKLLRRLQSQGYRAGGWQGVKFNTVSAVSSKTGACLDTEVAKAVLAPYLDANGGMCNRYGSSVILLDGVLQGATNKMVDKMGHLTAVPGTQGRVLLPPVSSTTFSVKDLVTGEDLNLLNQENIKEVWLNNTVGYSIDNTKDWVAARFADADHPEFRAINAQLSDCFRKSGYWYVATGYIRERIGCKKLTTKYYPENTWARDPVHITKDESDTSDIEYIETSDAVSYIVGGEVKIIHKSELKKGDVKLHKFGNMQGYVQKGGKFHVTSSGRKVHPSYNYNIVKGWKGYDFYRNLTKSLEAFGTTILYNTKDLENAEFYNWLKAFAKEKVALYSEFVSIPAQVRRALSSCNLQRMYVYPKRGNTHFRSSVWTNDVDVLTLDELGEFLRDCKGQLGQSLQHKFAAYAIDEFIYKLAEMQAVEAPQYLSSPVVQEQEEMLEAA